MAESFSTDVRGTAIGGAYNIGRVGAAIAPATIGSWHRAVRLPWPLL